MKKVKYKIYVNQAIPYEVKVSDRAVKFLENLNNPGSFIAGGFQINRDGKDSDEMIANINDLKSIVELIDKGILRKVFGFTAGMIAYKKQEIIDIK